MRIHHQHNEMNNVFISQPKDLKIVLKKKKSSESEYIGVKKKKKNYKKN